MQVIQYFETFRQFNSQDALDSSLAILRELKWCTSTGSETFSLFICLDANQFVLLTFFSLVKTIDPRVSTKPLTSDSKSPLPVDVRRSKMLLLKLPNVWFPGLSWVYLVILCFWVKDSPLFLACEQALHSGKSREVTTVFLACKLASNSWV